MNERRRVVMRNGQKGYLLGIFQYGSSITEEGTEPLAVIEMEDGSIESAVTLSRFHFVREAKSNA